MNYILKEHMEEYLEESLDNKNDLLHFVLTETQ